MENHKRGFFADSFIMLLYIFILAVIFVCFLFVAGQLKATGNSSIDSNMNNSFLGLQAFNTIAPLFVVISGLALIGSAFAIRSTPVFFIVFLILQVIFCYAAIQFSIAWYSLFAGTTMTATASLFTQWTIVFQYFPFVSILLSILFAIAIFAKGD